MAVLSVPDELVASGRYRIDELIGRGGMGAVYRAFDRERSNEVALKLLTGANPVSLHRFKNEFRALTELSHPNLLPLYELESSGERWFYTMELVRGVNFARYVGGRRAVSELETAPVVRSLDTDSATRSATHLAGATRGPVAAPDLDTMRRRSSPLRDAAALARLRAALKQLAQGVHALHRAGHLHRDLKPSNVLVRGDGRLVVLDFGVVLALAQSGAGDGLVVGTPAYMAPEQAAGEALSEATDWYAFGSMLYEALAGQRPFQGTTRDILLAKQHTSPVPLAALAPEVPADLAELADALLARDPAARPSGDVVLDWLGGVAERVILPAMRALDAHVALFGRDHDLGTLQRMYADCVDGAQRTVYVRGSSGAGKSALVNHFLGELSAGDRAVVLAGRCYEQESVPYKAVDAVIDALVTHLAARPAEVRAALVPPNAAALARLFPVVERIAATDAAPAPPDLRELKRRAIAALRQILVNLTDDAPVVIYIDDAQWGDADSASLLAQLLAGASPPPVLLLLAFRHEEHDASPFLRTLDRWHACDQRIDVGPLARADARNLALSLLADHADRDRVADEIADECDGNPFFAMQLALYANDRARAGTELPRRPGGRDAGVRLDQMLAERIAALGGDAQRLLEVIAVAGQPIALSNAAAAAELEGVGAPATTLLRNSRMIRARRERGHELLEPYHDRVRASVVNSLAPTRLRGVHRRLARELCEAPSVDPETLMAHYEGADEGATAANYAALAAANAARALAFDRAAWLYGRALELGRPQGRARAALLADQAEALSNSGHGSEAGDLYLEAARHAPVDQARQLRASAANQYLRVGRVDDGVEHLRGALAGIGFSVPAGRRRAIARLVWQRVRLRLRGYSYRDRPADEQSPELLRRVDEYWNYTIGLGMVNGFVSAELITRGLRCALDAGELNRCCRGLAAETMLVALSGGDRRRTDALRVETQSIAERTGEPYAVAAAASADAFVAYHDASFARAEASATRAYVLFRDRCAGVEWEANTAGLFSAWALYYLGDYRRFHALATSALASATERGDRYAVTAWNNGVGCAQWLLAGDHARARAMLDGEVASWPDPYGFNLQQYWELLARMLVAVYQGQTLGTWQMARDRWPALRAAYLLRIPMVEVEAAYARACCALLAAPEAGRPALADARRWSRVLRRHRLRLGPALANVIDAGLALAAGDDDTAEALLGRAVAGFTVIEAAGHAAAARFARGRLLGGDEGRALCTTALASLVERGVSDPERFAFFLVPVRRRPA